MSTINDILDKARAYTQQSPFLKKVVSRVNLVSPLIGPVTKIATDQLMKKPTTPQPVKQGLGKTLAGPEYFKNIVDNNPDMNMKKAAQSWLDRHSKDNGFQGLWGTNQDYAGPGGFNYATPEAALRAQQPTEDYPSIDYSGGYNAGSNFGGGMDFSQFDSPATPVTQGQGNMSSSPYDIAKYKHEVLNSADMPLEDLYRAAQGLNDARNDIATGTRDPFNLGVNSNIPFNPDQLANIEKRLAGSYDPAINDVNARILSKMDANKNAASGSSWGTGFMSTIPNQFRDEINNQQKQYASEPIIKNLQTIAPAYTFIASLDPNKATNSEMQAALIGFTKNLDPTSVVREGELALTTAYASNPTLLNRLKQEWNKSVATGQVVPTYALKQVISAFQKNYDGVLKNAQYVKKQYEDGLKYNYGLNDEQISNVLRDYTASGYQPAGGGTSKADIDLLLQNGVITPQRYQQLLQQSGFNGVGGGTNSASNVRSLSDAMSRIARNESDGSGGYKALGPVLSSGMYKGQRAIGKYQVMEGNITPWAKELLGINITPQQFYANPQLQDRLVSAKMNQYYKKYGNWADVASAWFTGGPVSVANAKKKDAFGTSGAQYVNKFLS